jgi:hypothetical protein
MECKLAGKGPSMECKLAGMCLLEAERLFDCTRYMDCIKFTPDLLLQIDRGSIERD